MKNGKAVLKMLQSMSEEELDNTFFDTIEINLADVDNVIREIQENGLLGVNATADDYDKLDTIPVDIKRKMLNQVMMVSSGNYCRNEYIESMLNYLRYIISHHFDKKHTC